MPTKYSVPLVKEEVGGLDTTAEPELEATAPELPMLLVESQDATTVGGGAMAGNAPVDAVDTYCPL